MKAETVIKVTSEKVEIPSKGIQGSNENDGYLDPAQSKLFVGGLSWKTTSEKLREYFGQFGNISDVLIMKDPITQRNRGFGFITFSTPAAVDRVLAVPTHTLDDKQIDPKPATPKSKTKTNKTKKIFVGGVSQETLVDDVKAYFNQFGSVEEAVMLMDQQTKRHRGFGFVTFESDEVVDRVCEIHFHSINNKKVECKKAQSKEVVQASKSGKQVILGTGCTPTPGLPAAMHLMPGMATFPQIHYNLQSQLATSDIQGAYGKLPSTAGFSSHRYSPYPLPGHGGLINFPTPLLSSVGFPTPPGISASTQGMPPHPFGTIQPNQVANLGIPTYPQLNQAASQRVGHYPGYDFSNVDMSSFSAVDWSGMAYGLPGMYSM